MCDLYATNMIKRQFATPKWAVKLFTMPKDRYTCNICKTTLDFLFYLSKHVKNKCYLSHNCSNCMNMQQEILLNKKYK